MNNKTTPEQKNLEHKLNQTIHFQVVAETA